MTGIIIQARMGSNRLPGKSMTKIAGKPLLYYVVNRSSQSKLADIVIIATSDKVKDNIIAEWSKNNSKSLYRGSENDVLDRYYHAAKINNISTIVRVTADNPFVDPRIIDKAITLFRENDVDFCFCSKNYPYGLGVEVIKFKVLEKAWKEAIKPDDREHVTPYIRNRPELFSQVEVPLDTNLSRHRLTVDFPEDLEVVRILIEKFGAAKMGWKEIIDLLERNPWIKSINSGKIDVSL